MKIRHIILILFFVFALADRVSGQLVTFKGVVKDVEKEYLPSAHVFISPDSITTSTDVNGKFSLRLSPGKKYVQISFVGYQLYRLSFNLSRDSSINAVLSPHISQLQEVEIREKRDYQEEILNSNRTSTTVITQDDINAIPVLGGEADLIKTLQLLPGTLRGVEGSSDLFVRGGAADQNLVLLDDAPIYNTSHLFGFLSVFNPDVLNKVEAINGGFPAEYGGRLSSILDIRTKYNIADATHLSGDIGLIASRLFVEQPIIKDKASLWVAARRTYIDKVVKAIGEELPYFFYDINGKVVFNPTSSDQLEIGYYSGDDILDLFRDRNNDGNGFVTRYTSGNSSQTVRWTRTSRDNISTKLSLIRSAYKYNITNSFEDNALVASSDIVDYGTRFLFKKDSLYRGGSFSAGLDWTRHNISPNLINTTGFIAELLESSSSTKRIANEYAAFVQYELPIMPRLRINTGIRASMVNVTGKKYYNPEPRFSARYNLNENAAIKISYSRMVQYLHRISNSAVSSPTDIWYPVTDSIKPQTSHLVALAWQRSLPKSNIFLSVEGYYKIMNHLIGYEEGTNLFFNTDFESKLIQGAGSAYGIEFLLKKQTGKLSGWVSYTLSWAWRRFSEINQGDWFPSRYDRRHNGALVMQYVISKRWAASLVWEFISGARFTPVVGQYVVLAPSITGVDLVPLYTGINQVMLANTHRLDLGIKFKSKPENKFQWQWFVGVYNTYNRANPIGISIEQNEVDNSLRYEQPGLFGLLPFISYGFKF